MIIGISSRKETEQKHIRRKHWLIVRIVSFKVFQHISKRAKPLCRNFTARNSWVSTVCVMVMK